MERSKRDERDNRKKLAGEERERWKMVVVLVLQHLHHTTRRTV